jgi:hypothetical protein
LTVAGWNFNGILTLDLDLPGASDCAGRQILTASGRSPAPFFELENGGFLRSSIKQLEANCSQLQPECRAAKAGDTRRGSLSEGRTVVTRRKVSPFCIRGDYHGIIMSA